MSKYRFDNRSKAEFQKDIKNHTMTERALFLLWLDHVENTTGTRPKYKDTGCGKDGDYLEDREVSTDPDFDVEGFGEIEVKFSKPMLNRCFHLKVNQVKAYRERGATILMVNGASEETPQFTMLKPPALKAIMEDCQKTPWKGFGWKEAYRIPVNKFVWRSLK